MPTKDSDHAKPLSHIIQVPVSVSGVINECRIFRKPDLLSCRLSSDATVSGAILPPQEEYVQVSRASSLLNSSTSYTMTIVREA